MEQVAPMISKPRIKLPIVPQKLKERTNKQPPSYRSIWTAAVNGSIPAELGPNGRWTVAEDDLDVIAAAFGLAPAVAA